MNVVRAYISRSVVVHSLRCTSVDGLIVLSRPEKKTEIGVLSKYPTHREGYVRELSHKMKCIEILEYFADPWSPSVEDRPAFR